MIQLLNDAGGGRDFPHLYSGYRPERAADRSPPSSGAVMEG